MVELVELVELERTGWMMLLSLEKGPKLFSILELWAPSWVVYYIQPSKFSSNPNKTTKKLKNFGDAIVQWLVSAILIRLTGVRISVASLFFFVTVPDRFLHCKNDPLSTTTRLVVIWCHWNYSNNPPTNLHHRKPSSSTTTPIHIPPLTPPHRHSHTHTPPPPHQHNHHKQY